MTSISSVIYFRYISENSRHIGKVTTAVKHAITTVNVFATLSLKKVFRFTVVMAVYAAVRLDNY